MRMPAILLLAVLAGCASHTSVGWPSLASRPGERPSGGPVCERCGPALPEGAVPPAPPPPPAKVLPVGIASELAAINRAITKVEAALPERVAALRKTQAAMGKGSGEDAAIAVEIERTRFDALVLPLGELSERIDGLDAGVDGAAGAETVTPRLTALRTRIAALRRTAEGAR